jgi:hypothetical protein
METISSMKEFIDKWISPTSNGLDERDMEADLNALLRQELIDFYRHDHQDDTPNELIERYIDEYLKSQQ